MVAWKADVSHGLLLDAHDGLLDYLSSGTGISFVSPRLLQKTIDGYRESESLLTVYHPNKDRQ